MSRWFIFIALCLAFGATSFVVLASDGPQGQRASRAAQSPPDANIRGCRDRITGAFTRRGNKTTPFKFVVDPRRDTIIGPVAFDGAATAGRPRVWRSYVRRDQWLKSIAKVSEGARVTLEVPAEQRAWMTLEYDTESPNSHAITLVGCRRLKSRSAQRRECGPGPMTTCRSGPTPFSGGFTIDYERASQQGRCAELIVWIDGSEEPLRRAIFRPPRGVCA
jgi:hypothetical protein